MVLLLVFGKRSERLLRAHVPPHAFDGILPPRLHALQGGAVRLVTRRDHLFQVLVFHLDHLITRGSTEWGIARATHLPTGHRFHRSRFLFVIRYLGPPAASVATYAASASRDYLAPAAA